MENFDENVFKNNIKTCIDENIELPYQFDQWFQDMIFSGVVYLGEENIREFIYSQPEEIVSYAMEFGKCMENVMQEANNFNMDKDVAQVFVDWSVAKYIKKGVKKINAEIIAYENDHNPELVSEYGSAGKAFNHIYDEHIVNTSDLSDEMLDLIVDKIVKSKKNTIKR